MAHTSEIDSILRKKAIKIFSYVSVLMRAKNINQIQLSEKTGINSKNLNRIFRSFGDNLSLEVISKFEKALETEIIVTPLHYEEHLLNNPDRIIHLAKVAIKHSPDFKLKIEEIIK